MRMDEKTVLITGANSGVGYAAARELAAAGAEIVMVCRDADRGRAAERELRSVAQGPAPTLLLADLSSQAQVRALAGEVRDRFERIDVLLNNAGGVFPKRELSVDGVEMTLATNHVAPFLLTLLLLDQLHAAPGGRVVTVATEIYAKKLDFDNLQSERSHQFFKAYQRSKLCNVLFGFELARRLEGTALTSNVVSPGPSKTRFGDNMSGPTGVFLRTMKRLPIFGSPEKGARTLLYAISDPSLIGVSGRFYYKLRELETKPVTHDLDVAAQLWALSEQLCGGNVPAVKRPSSPVRS